MHSIKLDWILRIRLVLDWIGLDSSWIMLDWFGVGLHWIGFRIKLELGLDHIGLDFGLDFVNCWLDFGIDWILYWIALDLGLE